jgi:hypothetical protein
MQAIIRKTEPKTNDNLILQNLNAFLAVFNKAAIDIEFPDIEMHITNNDPSMILPLEYFTINKQSFDAYLNNINAKLDQRNLFQTFMPEILYTYIQKYVEYYWNYTFNRRRIEYVYEEIKNINSNISYKVNNILTILNNPEFSNIVNDISQSNELYIRKLNYANISAYVSKFISNLKNSLDKSNYTELYNKLKIDGNLLRKDMHKLNNLLATYNSIKNMLEKYSLKIDHIPKGDNFRISAANEAKRVALAKLSGYLHGFNTNVVIRSDKNDNAIGEIQEFTIGKINLPENDYKGLQTGGDEYGNQSNMQSIATVISIVIFVIVILAVIMLLYVIYTEIFGENCQYAKY